MMEIRATDEEGMKIEGRAIVFNSPQTYQFGDEEYTEIIAPGALDNTDMRDVPLRYNHHDEFLIMARTRNKSLELIKSHEGLDIVSELIDTSSNRDVYTSIKSGLLDKMSFAFTTRKGTDKWESRPAWDAWIEIATPYQLKHIIRRRVPHGTRGLKFH